MTTKKVFISYSHEDNNHNDWVRKLAENLVNNGVLVFLDQWNLQAGDDLGLFMEQSISKSDYTLIICTPKFAEKVNSREGGVGYEAELIVGNIMMRHNYKTKFIPVLKKGLPSESIPLYLSSRLFVDFVQDSKYQKSFDTLLRRIFDAPLYESPKLGPSPVFITNKLNEDIILHTPRTKVLVVGLGIEKYLTEEIVRLSKDLGKRLARNSYGLITGGWPGVDEIVARSFSEEILRSNLPLENFLTQIIVKTYVPAYTGGNLILVNRGDSEWIEPVLNCDSLVLINGFGGTYETAKYGVQFNKPIFPIADSGGDARKMYVEILINWELYPYRNISKNQFQRLGNPVDYSLDGLFELLKLQFGEN